ncbi:carbon-nitrogen hydrolase family protein [Fischerella sp. PCC 9605]|uniref:carbon-nitrogen hydrolase family protein n=1 Tax=Fischerella sp. PCC 9605 TaxID=1173024 RepID=UPI00047D185E|nr:carbon-nitrogen hydrolase family protein [Fischerella sp. PCC 9605]
MFTTLQKSAKKIMGGRESVKVAIVQISQAYMDKEKSIERACAAIKEAGENGAELIVFPENWLAGYPYWTEGWNTERLKWIAGRVRFHDAAIMAPSEDTEKIGQAARTANAYVVMGCNEIDPRPEVDTIYSSLIYFSRDGSLMGRHRKLMPTGQEKTFWGMGDASDLVVFETDIGRIGGLICGEHAMTLVRAALIAQGEDFHVSVWHGSFALHKGLTLVEADTEGVFFGQALARAHSVESGAFTLLASSIFDDNDIPEDFPYKKGDPDFRNYHHSNGGSTIINPLGVPIAGPVHNQPTILYAECHAWMRKAHNAILDTMGHYARPDVLQLLIRDEMGWRLLTSNKKLAPVLRDALLHSAERHDVDGEKVIQIASGNIEAE